MNVGLSFSLMLVPLVFQARPLLNMLIAFGIQGMLHDLHAPSQNMNSVISKQAG
jgi:hypothetical protein